MFRPAEREGGVREDVESLDYDIDSSSIFEQDLQQQSAQYRRCQNAQRWVVCGAIGATTGFVAFLIDVFTAQILQGKYALAAAAMQSKLASAMQGSPAFGSDAASPTAAYS